MQIKNSIIFLLIFFSAVVSAQPPQSGISTRYVRKGLTIGDKAPAIFIPKIINDKKPSANLADFKDQLLIIDFWDTQCSACVEALPRMQGLQKQFGNAIKILPVTYEEKLLVSTFLQNNKYVQKKGFVIPTVVEDRLLASYFNYQFVCHEVWIYKGKIIALTAMDYVTAPNIQLILDGKKNNWLVKDDFGPDLQYDKPLLKIDENQYVDKAAPFYYSALFGYRKNPPMGKTDGTTYDSIRHTRRDYFFNYPIRYAYYIFWSKANTTPGKKSILSVPDDTHTILEVKDSSRFQSKVESTDYYDVWLRKTSFCFEAVSPDNGQTEQQQGLKLVADLDHALGLRGRFETRKMKCLVLVRTSDVDKIKSNTSKEDALNELDGPVKKIHRGNLATVVYFIGKQATHPFVYDETNYKDMVDLDLPFNSWTDIPSIRKALQAYDLDLKEEERDQAMLVITDKK